MIAERERQLGSIRARIAATETAPGVLDLEVRRLEREARAHSTSSRTSSTRTLKKADVPWKPCSPAPSPSLQSKRLKAAATASKEKLHSTAF